MQSHSEQSKSAPTVTFLYAYVHKRRDATASAIRQLAESLTSHGFNVKLDGIDATSLRESPISRALQQIRFLGRSAWICMKASRRPGVIVTVDVPTGLGLVGALCRTASGGRTRHINLVMDLYQFQPGPKAGVLGRIRRLIDTISFRLSDEIVTIGDCMSELLRSTAGRRSGVIHVWQDERLLYPTTRSKYREKLGVDEDALLLLYSGHAGRFHPLESLVDVVADLPPGSRVRFLISGYGTEIERLRTRVNIDGKLASRILFSEPVEEDQVAAFLSAGDVHVVSLDPIYTGTCIPSKTYAAMAVSRPCLFLGDRRSQAAKDVLTADAGVVVSHDDVLGLARAVEDFAANPVLRSKQGRNGYEFFVARRSRISQAAKWAFLLQKGARN